MEPPPREGICARQVKWLKPGQLRIWHLLGKAGNLSMIEIHLESELCCILVTFKVMILATWKLLLYPKGEQPKDKALICIWHWVYH